MFGTKEKRNNPCVVVSLQEGDGYLKMVTLSVNKTTLSCLIFYFLNFYYVGLFLFNTCF